jgi:two-component system, OmpR family, sensor histidine kinase MprB
MSLRRRITAAAAIAVAAVALSIGAIGYLSTRSQLLDGIRGELQQLVTPFTQNHGVANNGVGAGGALGGAGGGGGGNAGGAQTTPGTARPTGSGFGNVPGIRPNAPPLGGAPGYFQFVRADGTTRARDGGTPKLPVTAAVKALAARGRGTLFFTAKVRKVHVQILVVGIGRPGGAAAVEVSVPLTQLDSTLHNLALRYIILGAIGVLLAGLLGAVIARSALRPIEHFTEQTEAVTLDHPHRLEESSAIELARLADSFNRTLDALERSTDSQRNLIADASHELRTPMAALRSNIQILLEADRLPAEDQAGLQQSILAELDDLTQLVSDVVELARGSGPSSQVEPVELDGIVRDAISRAQRRAPGLEFTLDIEPTVVVGSSDRIARAVHNVIDNARKWSADDGAIDVSLRDGVLSVHDHGPGFAKADIAHVFDRFYRADAARRMPGSGLGLAIVKQAADSHGGFAQAANDPVGGAIVRVSFGAVEGDLSRPLLVGDNHSNEP